MLARLIESSPDPVTIVAIGPLTNLALLMAEQPETTRKVERIIIMGGGTNDALGNATAAAEFNIYYDPDAAARVFDFGVPLTMVGLNVTNRTLVSRKHLPSLFTSGGKISHMVGHILDDHQQRWGGDGSMAQHDALAMAALIDPDVISTRLLPVDVENTGRLTAGMTVVDYRVSGGEGGDQRPANVDVALDVDVSRFAPCSTSGSASSIGSSSEPDDESSVSAVASSRSSRPSCRPGKRQRRPDCRRRTTPIGGGDVARVQRPSLCRREGCKPGSRCRCRRR